MPTPEQIAKWTSEGNWPPPEGMYFLRKIEPNPVNVNLLKTQLGRELIEEKMREIRSVSADKP